MKGLLVAGTHSGSGKTTVTLGVMAALKKRGLRVKPFKCGPDFIDPSLHRLVTGETSINLDLWMSGQEFTRESYARHAAEGDIAVVEGVMGMFDGGQSSSGALAEALGLPVILVLDVRSMAESAAAIMKGFESFAPGVSIAGVILNMVGSDRHLQLVAESISKHCRAEILGHLPRNVDFSIPSRHLGLHMGEESPVSREALNLLADTIDAHVDMERLLQLSDISSLFSQTPLGGTGRPETLRIGVARDSAFCFYYQDNFDILEQLGCELCFFSPLEDSGLPENIAGLYLGGGYPELYGRQLSANRSLINEIREWAESGRTIYAECGGFMYLTEGITDLDGVFHPLVSFFPARAEMQTRRASLGYRELATRLPSFWGPAGTILRGHEFHYSKITPMADDVERIYTLSNGGTEGYRRKNCVGGYMHIHFGFNREAVSHFIQSCRE